MGGSNNCTQWITDLIDFNRNKITQAMSRISLSHDFVNMRFVCLVTLQQFVNMLDALELRDDLRFFWDIHRVLEQTETIYFESLFHLFVFKQDISTCNYSKYLICLSNIPIELSFGNWITRALLIKNNYWIAIMPILSRIMAIFH